MKKISTKYLYAGCLLLIVQLQQLAAQPPSHSVWKNVWSDEFNSNATLDQQWEFQNGPSGHILSSRWRDNAFIKDSILIMLNKEETRSGQKFTTASLWTKEKFKYGYFECRYRYGASPGLNNSFWLMNRVTNGDTAAQVEIDINEGHYPNQVATNTHRHQPLPHISNSRTFRIGGKDQPFNDVRPKQRIITSKIRVLTHDFTRARISEIRIYEKSEEGYPDILANGSADAAFKNNNLALNATATANGIYKAEFPASLAIDGKLDTRWTSADSVAGELVITLDKEYEIGAVQLITGWKKNNSFENPVYEYSLEYWNGKKWIGFYSNIQTDKPDLSKAFHVYGFEWNEKELIWYFDGKELRREPNSYCHIAMPVWLSSAVINLGPVTSRINGTSMDVDYVRVYKKEE